MEGFILYIYYFKDKGGGCFRFFLKQPLLLLYYILNQTFKLHVNLFKKQSKHLYVTYAVSFKSITPNVKKNAITHY